jgi:mRNA interferase MazF
MPPSPTYRPGDVVVVPFPFTDREASKRRPALVCSREAFNRSSGHVMLAMITSSIRVAWPGDVALTDMESAGLPSRSIVRWKVFTLDQAFILRRAGRLGDADRAACAATLPIGFA